MKKTIRVGVFETNSSSTHSMTLMSAEDFDKWDDNFLLDEGSEQLISREDAIEKVKSKSWNSNVDWNDEDEVNSALRDSEIYTPDQYFENEYMENFEQSYTTKSGEKVIAFGYYGHDG